LKCNIFIRQGEVFNAEDQPSKKRRLFSAIVRVEDEQDSVAEKEKGKKGLLASLVVCVG
jgi:hypothetical protein